MPSAHAAPTPTCGSGALGVSRGESERQRRLPSCERGDLQRPRSREEGLAARGAGPVVTGLGLSSPPPASRKGEGAAPPLLCHLARAHPTVPVGSSQLPSSAPPGRAGCDRGASSARRSDVGGREPWACHPLAWGLLAGVRPFLPQFTRPGGVAGAASGEDAQRAAPPRTGSGSCCVAAQRGRAGPLEAPSPQGASSPPSPHLVG